MAKIRDVTHKIIIFCKFQVKRALLHFSNERDETKIAEKRDVTEGMGGWCIWQEKLLYVLQKCLQIKKGHFSVEI